MNRIFRALSLGVQAGRFADSIVLRPLSGLWGFGAKTKNWLYDRNIISITRCSVPVVSVGALTAGGTHKTPLIHLLAKTLRPFGTVAILSRGYRSNDEPTLLQRKLSDVLILVGKNRVALGKMAEKRGARILLLDDGFQYRSLYRDLELLTISRENPYGYGVFLPRGVLRDSPSRLKEADAIFVNGETPCEIQNLPIPTISMRLETRRILDLRGNESSSLVGQKVGAFCGIAQPSRFFDTIKQLGAERIESLLLADHEHPKENALRLFAKRCQIRGATALVCTEKDAVKLSFNPTFPLPIFYVEVELQIYSGHSEWKNLIEKIVLKMRK
jgi:tetraacyldisaccharide 4'-kinase